MDIALTHASGTPAARSVTLVQTRQPGRTVAETLAATGTRWLAAHDDSCLRDTLVAFEIAIDTTLRSVQAATTRKVPA